LLFLLFLFFSRVKIDRGESQRKGWGESKAENGSRFGLAWEEKRGKTRGERPRRVWGMPKCQSKYETPARGEKEGDRERKEKTDKIG
jgi:hypothetical protein